MVTRRIRCFSSIEASWHNWWRRWPSSDREKAISRVDSSRPSWRNVASAAALMTTLQIAPPLTVVECTIPDDAAARVFRLVDTGPSREPRWRLTLRSRALRERVVELPLPQARVQRRGGHLELSSVSNNGGLAVEISTNPHRPILDVFVNFELEVNVWRDLSPDVDQMNTQGPLKDAACRGVSLPPQLLD